MGFKEATDDLCTKVDHGDIASALGISVQAIRQARMHPSRAAHRGEPQDWEDAIIRLAEERVWHFRNLIEQVRGMRGSPQ